jgi:S-DNA-T family DNA segregation ATPase FtsK/SpoIIIE
VSILEARAELLAAVGQRVWEPSPDMPALVIIVDEYAELVESAPEATGDADSISRRGRAVAVTLVAATQRPTQKAMGQGPLRSQMDVRICFRVRERKDVDLVLGQGMLSAGWQAHRLNAPGKFLISAPEYDTPRRARAYLLTDQAVNDTANAHAGLRPELDEVSKRAREEHVDRQGQRLREAREPAAGDDAGHAVGGVGSGPEVVLWAALSLAPEDGISVPELMSATGMSRPWVYQRLREMASRGQVVQVGRGRWRATVEHSE